MEGYLAEVRLFAANFNPRNWQYCHGQLLAINTNQALFSLIGTTYGGDGRTNFALPDTRSRVVIGAGHGAGLPDYQLGEKGGTQTVALTLNEMPQHNHLLSSTSLSGTVAPPYHADAGTSSNPVGQNFAVPDSGAKAYGPTADAALQMSTVTITGAPTAADTGGGQAHNNIQPINTLHYIICTTGTFPSRN